MLQRIVVTKTKVQAAFVLSTYTLFSRHSAADLQLLQDQNGFEDLTRIEAMFQKNALNARLYQLTHFVAVSYSLNSTPVVVYLSSPATGYGRYGVLLSDTIFLPDLIPLRGFYFF